METLAKNISPKHRLFCFLPLKTDLAAQEPTGLSLQSPGDTELAGKLVTAVAETGIHTFPEFDLNFLFRLGLGLKKIHSAKMNYGSK